MAEYSYKGNTLSSQQASSTPSSQKSPADIKKVVAPTFSWRFLLPNYWLIWVGVIVLYTLSWLPFAIIVKLGSGFGRLIKFIAPKRVQVAKRNIALCFKDWPKEKVNEVLEANIKRTGMGLCETAMGWWWPSWRVQKHCSVEGFDEVQKILDSGRGVFGLALHNVNLEMGCRGLGYKHQSVGFYRKHNNPLMDYLQYHGRTKSNKYFVDKRNAKALIQALNDGELCLYLPDQDYGAKQSIFVPFGDVSKTATTTATLMFASRANAVPFLLSSQYTSKGYVIKFISALEYLADNNLSKEEALTLLNADILKAVKLQPDSYLWMHKRFKTRPSDAPESFYK
jgi:KDO2-lipid IV(A) lauroyltransferase